MIKNAKIDCSLLGLKATDQRTFADYCYIKFVVKEIIIPNISLVISTFQAKSSRVQVLAQHKKCMSSFLGSSKNAKLNNVINPEAAFVHFESKLRCVTANHSLMSYQQKLSHPT